MCWIDHCPVRLLGFFILGQHVPLVPPGTWRMRNSFLVRMRARPHISASII